MGSTTTSALTGRERQRLETRSRLYELALSEFRRVGVEKTRIRDIVEEAGVVPGTFYFHFPTKRHVLLELGNQCIARVVEELPGSPESPAPLAELLDGLVDATALVERELGDPELFRAAASSFQRPPSDALLATHDLVAMIHASVECELAGREQEQELSAEEITVLILTSFFGALLVGPDNPQERTRLLQRSLRFFANTLARSD